MSQPTLEVADIIEHRAADSRTSRFAPGLQHRKVMDAIVRCRTAALGGHRDQCLRCGHQAISYNSAATGTAPSARATHAPSGSPRARPSCARALLPTSSSHCPTSYPALVLQNKRLLYDLLFRSSAATLIEVALATRSTWALTSDCSVCSIPGDRTYSIIPMSTVSCRAEVWHSMDPDGYLLLHGSCPSVFSAASSSSGFFLQLVVQGKLQFHGSAGTGQETRAPPPVPAHLFERVGRLRQAALRRAAHVASLPGSLHTASPSPTIASSPARRIASPSAGRTTPTAASRR